MGGCSQFTYLYYTFNVNQLFTMGLLKNPEHISQEKFLDFKKSHAVLEFSEK